MLKKLLRHELIETWKIPAISISTSLIVTMACALYFYMAPYPETDVALNVGNFALLMGYSLLMSCASLLIVVYLGIRFYKNLYTDEGYLMHTLPVCPWMLITSKALVGVLWSYLGSFLMFLTMVPVLTLALPKTAEMTNADINLVRETLSGFIGKRPLEIFFFLVPYMLVGCAFSILVLYAAISLGQLFNRHKVLASILCFLGLQALLSTATSLLMLPGMTGVIIKHADDTQQFMAVVMPSMMRTVYIISFFADIILTAAAFWLTNYIMQKNLNLD